MKKNLKDSLKDPQIFLQIILMIIYYFLDIIYLVKLNNFNKLMESKGWTAQLNNKLTINSITVASEILNAGGWNYLYGALIFTGLGILLVFVLYKIGKETYYPQICFLIKLVNLTFFIIFIVLLCILVNNPVVRAFLIVAGVVAIGMTVYGN